MTKVAIRRLDSVTHNDTAATTLINENFNSIQTALENTLSRDGTTPNFMDAELDMNGRRIINGAEAVEDTDYVTYGQIKEDVAGAARAAEEAAASAAKADVSAQSASISAQTAIVATREARSIKDYVDNAVLDENLVSVAEDLAKGEDSEIIKLNKNKENIDTVATNIEDVTTVSSNIADVNTVAADIENVKAVADNQTNIDTVATDKANIDTVAGSIAAVAGVAAISAAVVAVEANKSNIDTVAGVAGDVSTIAGIANDVTTVAANETDIKNVAANRDNIITVASSTTDINKVASNIDNIDSVVENFDNITTVAGNIADVVTVAANKDNIKTVADSKANIDTVADDIMDVMTVAGIYTQVQSVADNMSAVVNVDAVKEDVATVAANKDAVQVAAENIDDIKEAANAKIWAEGTDPEVTGIGGTHSAKGWAELAESVVGYGEATEEKPGIVRLATEEEAREGFDNSAAMTPLKTTKVIYDNVGRGIQLGFTGTLEGDTLTFETADAEPYTIKQGYNYEIDLLFQAAGILPDDIKVVIKNGTDTINIVNVLHDDFTKPITVGCLKQLMKYNDVAGWRWVFNSRFTVAQDGTKVFVMPSTVVNAATDVIYNRLHDALLANPDMIRYENDTSITKILAGSTFVYPNGHGVFDERTITSNIQTQVFPDHDQLIFTNGTQLFYIDADKTFAGTTAPTAYTTMLWYDTAENVIKYTGNGGTSWSEGYAFPFGIANSTGIVDCFCNGIGYFANCVWILDGVEVLIPNGKQEDGSFNNTTYTVTRPLVFTFDDTREGEWALGPSGIIVAAQGFEVSEQNRVINKQTGAVVNGCPMGKFKTTTGRVETLEVRDILDLTIADSAKNGSGSGAGAAFNLFDIKWSDHLQNDASWLRADTFSWQSGAVYTAAYNELKTEYDAEVAGGWQSVIKSETIEGINISYFQTAKGYKIVFYNEADESTHANYERLQQLYTTTGIAWYYILDTANARFKLPRNKYGFRGVDTSAGNYFKGSVPNITSGDARVLAWKSDTEFSWTEGALQAASSAHGGLQNNTGNWLGSVPAAFDAAISASEYQDGAAVQSRSVEMYLYFYVGNTVRNVTEVNVGALTEIVNNLDVTEAVNEITTAKNTAVSAVTTAGNTNTTSVNNAGISALTNIDAAKTSSVTEINNTKETAITQINVAGEAIADYQQPITAITATSGTVPLEVSKIYTMSVTGATTFSLPTPSLTTVFNQIKVMMKVTGTPAITWGTTQFFNKTTPEIEAGSYDVYFDYDNLLSAWVCGVMPKGAAE